MSDYFSSSPVRGGILQGSVVQPLLFLVYVNDMPALVHHGNLLQLADDTILICFGDTSAEVEKKLPHDLKLISKWISLSRMQLNITKSRVMWFSSKHSKRKLDYTPVMIDGQPYSCCYLRIIFDCYLQWNAQVSEVCCKCSYYLCIFNRA